MAGAVCNARGGGRVLRALAIWRAARRRRQRGENNSRTGCYRFATQLSVTGRDRTGRLEGQSAQNQASRRLANTAWDRTKRQLPNQKMGGACRPGRRGVLPSAFRRRSCDPTLLHHGRYCAHRRHGRSPDAHLSHAHGGGVDRAAADARSYRSSELPDVVCGDAGAGRRLSARIALDERGRQDAPSPRRSRSGADGRLPACCWFRSSPVPRPFPSSPIISIASLPTA